MDRILSSTTNIMKVTSKQWTGSGVVQLIYNESNKQAMDRIWSSTTNIMKVTSKQWTGSGVVQLI